MTDASVMWPESDRLDALGFGDDELVETLNAHLGVGIDEKLPPRERFVLNIARLIGTRLIEDPDGETLPSIFFFLEDREVPDATDRYEPLLHNGVVVAESCFWFVGETGTNARGLHIKVWDDGAAFELAIDQMGLGAWPAVVFDPRPQEPAVRYYPHGLTKGDMSRPVAVRTTSIELQDVFEEIDRVNNRHLASPMSQPKLWAKKGQHWAKSNAESLIQLQLETALQARYLTCDVRTEQTSAAGRHDLQIFVPVGAPNGPKTPAALLELKVLRSFGEGGDGYSPTKTKNWIADGVVQVASYRDDHHFPDAALCCFDMRVMFQGDRCFGHVVEKAAERRVALRVWPIFNSTPAYRRWRDAAKYA